MDYQNEFGKAFGAEETMFNPYDINSIYSSYSDFTGILNTQYFINYYALRADIWNVGLYIKSSMV